MLKRLINSQDIFPEQWHWEMFHLRNFTNEIYKKGKSNYHLLGHLFWTFPEVWAIFIFECLPTYIFTTFMQQNFQAIKMTQYLSINPVLNLEIPASINFYQLLMKFTNRLMKVLMSAVYFSTYLRPLIKYGMMVLFSNSNRMAYLVTF